MATKKSFISKLISFVLTLFLIIFFIFVAGCGYINNAFGVDVFDSIACVYRLNIPVNETALLKNAVTDKDMENAKKATDLSISNLIIYDETNGYSINEGPLSSFMQAEIKLTDKQVGAIANTLINSQDNFLINAGETSINLKDFNVQVRQVEFSKITENSANFNVILKLNVEKFKNDYLAVFPISLAKGFIPNDIYVSSTIKVTKTDDAFGYKTESVGLIINYLSEKQTEDLLKLVNLALPVGNSSKFAKLVGDVFVNALIGNEENDGLSYRLKPLGAKTFAFTTDGTNNYYSIKI